MAGSAITQWTRGAAVVAVPRSKMGFYEDFKEELPQFHASDPVAHVVGEALRAAKRAEMKFKASDLAPKHPTDFCSACGAPHHQYR